MVRLPMLVTLSVAPSPLPAPAPTYSGFSFVAMAMMFGHISNNRFLQNFVGLFIAKERAGHKTVPRCLVMH